MYVTNTLDQTPNINAITQKVNYRINVLSSIVKYSDHKTRKILYESIIISVFRYCCETLIDSRARNLNILNVLLSKCAHNVIGFRSYKMNLSSIYKELKWLSASQLIISQSLKSIHKISFEIMPPALTVYMRHSMVSTEGSRLCRKPSLKYMPSSAKTLNGFFHRSVYIYNQIEDNYRMIPSKKFNKQISKYISIKFNYRDIPKIPNSL